ncbi:MAG: S-layer homology domain-containing protein [Eubacteriales bacterium]
MDNIIIKKIYIVFFLTFLFLGIQAIKVEGNELGFDGSQSTWAESELEEAYEYNLTYPEVMKNFNRNITREEFSNLAVNLYESLTENKAEVESDPFTDTNNREVLKAYNLGIVKGRTSTIFAPKDYVTRQEICVMIFRVLNISGAEITTVETGDFPFSDTKNIASWALDSVKFAYQNDIMNGSDSKILPLNNTTREQGIVLLKRTYISFKDRIVKNEVVEEEYCDEGLCIDSTDKNNGLVKIGYAGKSTEKVKVMIEKDGERYVYPLVPNGKIVGFPLQMGNGKYKVSVLTNIADNRYAYIDTENFDVNISNQNSVYLNSIQLISWNSNSKAVRKNEEIVGDESNIAKKIDLAYEFIINNISYDYEKIKFLSPNYIPYPDKTIAELKGICYDYSSLFAAMKRSEKIPIKLVKGYSTHVDGYHAWNEVLINGEWIVVDTTSDAAYNKANVNYNFSKNKSNYTKVYEY